MKRYQALAAACAAAGALLAACGSSDDGDTRASPAFTVPELASASETASLRVVQQTDNALQTGRYLAAPDGQRLLMLAGDDGRITQLLVRDGANAPWRAVVGEAPKGEVVLANHTAQAAALSATLALPDAQASRGFEMLGAGQQTVVWQVDAQGRISSPAGAACPLAGSVSTTSLPQALVVDMTDAQACLGGAKAWKGWLLRDAQDAPAAFRLVSDGASPAVDKWVFAR